VQIWAARSIAKVFDKLSLSYHRTEKTNSPSFTKNFLSTHNHPMVKNIAKAREINKAHTTFIDTILKHQYRGRIHADINPIRSDQGGTVTDESVANIVEKFKDNSVDFHQTVADMANISRTQAKTINLGLFYGMGKAKLQAELGLNTRQEADDLFNQYHQNVPFVRDLMNYTSKTAQSSGSIGTLLGRRCRFTKWEPNQFGMHKPMEFEEAERTYGRGRIRRAFTYKALNKLIQGSAADMTKKAMVDLYNEGIVPHIQIHDELDISVESDEQAKKIIEIMENAVSLEVPNKVDYESGKTWGEING
jgi:DNA polymerase I-like protein with 3'-5' exonuclease and polymerase domains